jgi:hypothetical protein
MAEYALLESLMAGFSTEGAVVFGLAIGGVVILLSKWVGSARWLPSGEVRSLYIELNQVGPQGREDETGSGSSIELESPEPDLLREVLT